MEAGFPASAVFSSSTTSSTNGIDFADGAPVAAPFSTSPSGSSTGTASPDLAAKWPQICHGRALQLASVDIRAMARAETSAGLTMAWGVKLNAKSAPVSPGIYLSVCRLCLKPAIKRVLSEGVGRVVVQYGGLRWVGRSSIMIQYALSGVEENAIFMSFCHKISLRRPRKGLSRECAP